jgi:uncharacterized protein involved in outer membrane biogenesis
MRWKRLLGLVAILVVVAIAAAYVLLLTYDYNTLKPKLARAVQAATGRALTIGGDIDFALSLRPTFMVEDVAFQNAPWGSRPEMATAKHFEVTVALLPLLKGHVDIARLVLVEPTILLETDSAGRSNIDFGTPRQQPAPPPQRDEAGGWWPRTLRLRQLRIERGHLIYRDGRTGKTHTVILDRLSASAAGLDRSVHLKLEGAYDNEAIAAQGTLGPLTALFDAQIAWALDLTVKTAYATLSVAGTIDDPFTQHGVALTFTGTGTPAADLQALTGVRLPAETPFTVAGSLLSPAPGTYDLEPFQVAFGKNTLRATIKVEATAARPRITAHLASKHLDLRSLMAPRQSGPTSASRPRTPPGRVFPPTPFPLQHLGYADVTATIDIARLLLPRVSLEAVSLEARLTDRHLTVPSVEASLGGGRLKASLDLRPQGDTAVLATQATLRRFDFGRMLNTLQIKNAFTGATDVEVDLRGRGRTVAAWVATLDGSTSVVMDSGRIDNRYIDLLGTDLSASLLRLVNPLRQEAYYTAINCFVSRFDLSHGVASSTALVFDTERTSVVGEGSIDLRTEQLDLALQPFPKEGVGTKLTGSLNLSPGELLKSFKLGGTLAHPKLVVDPVRSAVTVGKAVGGTVLLGPIGIAAALIGSASGDRNRCLAALETAPQRRDEATPPQKQNLVEQATEGIGKGVKDAGKGVKALGHGIGKGFKKLFGR